jgi:TRAP transporter TAXI family solute receptor
MEVAFTRLPRWLRVAFVAAMVVLAGAVGLYAYRTMTQPVTLTVAVGSYDGDAARIMSAIASELASTKSPVRLKVLDKGSAPEAVKAFSGGQADLAVVRGDIGDLSAARTVALLTHGVVLLVAPPGSTIDSIQALKGKTVGVIARNANQKVIDVLTHEYDLDQAKVQFKDIAPGDIPQALKLKQVHALLIVTPISEKYLAMLRDLSPRTGKQQFELLPIESAGAIAALSRAYESYELPKGTIRGSPPIPDDDLTTLRVPFYLVANSKVDNDAITTLTKGVMDTRRELVPQYPILAHISAPSTDKDAYIPIHPGAAHYFDGEQKSFFDKYGDQFFYGSMLLGSLTSLLAGLWKFMARGSQQHPEARPLSRLYALTERIKQARTEADLADIEQNIDEVLKDELERSARGDAEAAETAALGLATHRLEHLINQRRSLLETVPRPALQA